MSDGHGYTLPVGTRIDNYEIRGILGEGGFGITYKAWDHELGCDVAIKEYLPSDLALRDHDGHTVRPKSDNTRNDYEYGLDMFVNEAKTLAAFSEQNIVQVKRFLRVNGTAYLVMNYVEGQSLSQHLRTHPQLDEQTIRDIFLPLLRGLSVVHDRNVLHRDIKPGNIYLREDGVPVLIDFGSAREALGSHSRSMTAIISPGYAPFEQYSSRSKPGPAMDLYAIGAAMYRCISGHTPLEAPERVDALHNGDVDPLVPAAELGKGKYSEAFLQAIDWMMATAAKDRPQSIAELLDHPGMGGEGLVGRSFSRDDEATEILRGENSVPSGPSVRSSQVQQASGKRGLVPVLLLMLLVGGGAGWWLLGKAPEDETSNPGVDLEKQAAAREAAQREQEKQRLAKLKAEKEKAEKDRQKQQALEAERKRLAEEKKQVQARRIAEKEKLEQERKRLEAERARLEREKLEAEKKRLDAERKRIEAEKRRIAARRARPAPRKQPAVAAPRSTVSRLTVALAVFGNNEDSNLIDSAHVPVPAFSARMKAYMLPALQQYVSKANIRQLSYTFGRDIAFEGRSTPVSKRLCEQNSVDAVIGVYFFRENSAVDTSSDVSYSLYDCRSGKAYLATPTVNLADGAANEPFIYAFSKRSTFAKFLRTYLAPLKVAQKQSRRPAPAAGRSVSSARTAARRIVLAVSGDLTQSANRAMSVEKISLAMRNNFMPLVRQYASNGDVIPVSRQTARAINFEGKGAVVSKRLCHNHRADLVLAAFFDFEGGNSGGSEQISYVAYDCGKSRRYEDVFELSRADGATGEKFSYARSMYRSFGLFLKNSFRE